LEKRFQGVGAGGRGIRRQRRLKSIELAQGIKAGANASQGAGRGDGALKEVMLWRVGIGNTRAGGRRRKRGNRKGLSDVLGEQ